MRRPPRSQIAEIDDAVLERVAGNAFKFPAESMQIESHTFNPRKTRARKPDFIRQPSLFK